MERVSVPFTRGTPLWRPGPPGPGAPSHRFSPLHEGDASVAWHDQPGTFYYNRFSPLHEGDASVALNFPVAGAI